MEKELQRHQQCAFNINNILVKKEDIEEIINGVYKKINEKRKKYNLDKNAIPEKVKMLTVNDIDYYIKAFTQNSFVSEMNVLMETRPSEYLQYKDHPLFDFKVPKSNETLEFTGDGILKGIMGEYFEERYPNQQEGFLSKMRMKLEKTATLAKFAVHLGLDRLVMISSYLESLESKMQGRKNIKILEDTFEAFLGAMKKDQGKELGYYYCYYFVVGVIEECIDFTEFVNTNENFKDSLIRYGKSSSGKTKWMEQPKYFVVYFSGPPNNRTFYSCVCLDIKDLSYIPDSLIKKQQNELNDYLCNLNKTITDPEYIKHIDKFKLELKKGYLPIGFGKGRKRIDSEQAASKEALINLNVDLNY